MIDLVVAKLINKGFAKERAESYAREVTNIAKANGMSPLTILDAITTDTTISELSSFLINNALRHGYKTGKMKTDQPNKYVARAVIDK